MASISRQANGRKVIQFFGADGIRRSLRLGKASLAMALTVKTHVEQLAAANITGHAVDDKTARWVADLDDVLHDKLAAVGLAPKRESALLGNFIESYIASRSDVKPATITTFKRTRNKVLQHFSKDIRMREITPGCADEFARWLRKPDGGGLCEATARKTVSIAKQVFQAGVRKRIIRDNPFAGLCATTLANRERDYFVSREETDKIMDVCPDAEWRVLVALCRYGGLRCPSEVLRVRWADVDWSRERITVHSPKTEHHEGGASRIIPMFPELKAELLEAFEQADDGAEYVIEARHGHSAQLLRKQLVQIVKHAGLELWPKPFQNMRATRETELADKFSAHVVCRWIGNSQIVAAKHYLQVTDEHYERAIQGDAEALQNAVQNTCATGCTTMNPENGKPASRAVNTGLRDSSVSCNVEIHRPMGDTGLEPVTSCMSSKRSSQLS